MKAPDRIVRTTLQNFLDGKEQYNNCVYVFADNEYGVLYIGKTIRKLRPRINEHFSKPERPIGAMLTKAKERNDLHDVRLDILVSPNEDEEWLYEVERELVQFFRPLFNNDHLGE